MSDESNAGSKGNKAEAENAQISNAYQTVQKPTSSASLDAAILAKAKLQADENKNVSSKPFSSPQSKRKWLSYQYSGSIAASIFLVAMLVIMLEPEYANNTDIVNDNGLVSGIEPSMSNTPEQVASLSQMDAISLRHDVQKEQPSQSRAFKQGPPQQRTPKQIAQENALQNMLADNAQRSAIEDEASLVQYTENPPVSADSKDISEPDKPLNTDVSIADLYKRLTELNRFNQEDSATTDSVRAKSKALAQSPREYLDMEEYDELQQSLFEALKEQKTEDQNWQLDEKYKIVLSNKQIELLESRKDE